MSATIEEYTALVNDLNRYSHEYYANSKSLISDAEYDKLYRKLAMIESQHPEYITKNSPTQKVGDTGGDFPKVRHPVRMYSLENVFDSTDLKKFYKRFSGLRAEMPDVDNYYLDCKMDGLSLDLIYHEGVLSTAISRGDGIIGEDLTQNALTIPNIPKRLHTKTNVIVHGEVVVHKSDFYAVNRERDLKGLEPFKNTRNYASGSLRNKDPEVTRERLLRFYAWELIVPEAKHYPFDEQIQYLIDLGFNTPQGQLCSSIEDILSFINDIARTRKDLPYSIDGVVIKQNTYEYRKALGWNRHAPLWATAWKFTADDAVTEITRITWNMGKTGRLTPVAHLKPVNINGVLISAVNLFNAENIESNKLGPSAKVTICRSGDVIPKITQIHNPGTYLGLPEECPFCHQPLERQGADIKCVNPDCSEMLIASLSYIVGKDALNINGMSSAFARELVESGTVKSVIDIFSPLDNKSTKISQDELDTLVMRMRNVNTMELLIILGIPNIGRAIAGKITAEVMSIHGLIKALNDEKAMRLLPINDVAKRNLLTWYKHPLHRELLDKIAAMHLTYLE